jgi:hypothetical protein
VDLGDWQELARLRFENHVWHLCITQILETVDAPGSTVEAIVTGINVSVTALNEQLVRLHRRPVAVSQRS